MKWVYEKKKKAGNFGNKIFISPTFFAFRKDYVTCDCQWFHIKDVACF